jgi:beta-lactamase class A
MLAAGLAGVLTSLLGLAIVATLAHTGSSTATITATTDESDGGAADTDNGGGADEQEEGTGGGGGAGGPFGGALDVANVAETAAAREAAQQSAQRALAAALDTYAAGVPAQFAVAVVDHRTGATYSYNPDLTVKTASIVKVDILAAALLQAQDAGRGLTASEQSLAAAMIENSDNDAADALWWSIGGDAGLAAYDTRLGLVATVPGTDGYWGATTTTVGDRIRLLDTITDPNGPLGGSRDYILSLMTSVSDDQDWGISAAADDGDGVAIKNGWIGLDDGWLINSTGIITGPDTDVTIAVLSQNESGYANGVAVVEQIATLARTAISW